MPRGSRHLDEPALYRHPDTGQERTATTKIEAISYEADGFRPAAELDEADAAEARSAAAKKAAETRARNAEEAAAKPGKPGGQAAKTTATETTEPNSGSGE